MKRRAILISILLALGSPVMARDTAYQYEPSLQGETEAERLINSPRGQELRGVVDLMMKGDKEAAEKALEAYREKYNPPPMGSAYPGSETQPRNPSARPYSGPSMMLPPEAR